MNPFKKDGHMLPIASINSVYVDDVLASDTFRPSLILEELIKHKDELGLSNVQDNTRLLFIFNELLNSDIDSIKSKATEIARMFGNRLTKVLVTLFNPSELSILNRPSWTEEHWNFWKTIDNIYLVGGLTSPILTQIFYECIEEGFQTANIKDKRVTFIEGSSNLGTHGLASIVTDRDYLLFDFGQTNIKRARHLKKNGNVIIDTILPSIQSDYLFYKTKSKREVKKIAKKLDDYIIKVIMDTHKQVAFTGNEVYLSIANYVLNGAIYEQRGGYGKLALLNSNYQEYLSNKLSKKLKQDIKVTLFHDTSAMALMFRNEPNTAVISLGTAFGIAFPE